MSQKKSKTPMTKPAASRVQSHADRSGKNQGFKQRAQRAASKNAASGGGKKGGGKKG